jgi:hypothetical protein
VQPALRCGGLKEIEMGILSRLFGSSGNAASTGKMLEYNGFTIAAAPFKSANGWQLAGEIFKDGKSHKFIRADQFASKDEAEEFAITKGKVIVDQMGEAMFNS